MQYRAGVRSLKDIGKEFGVSDAAVIKRAKRDGWTRDLSARIQAKAEALVSASVVSEEVSERRALTEKATVDANAKAVADAILAHRSDIKRNRGLVNKLLTELEAQVDNPEDFEQLGELMYRPDDKGVDKLYDLYKKVTALPSRVDSAKKLAETLKVLIGLEREAYRIDQHTGAEDNPFAALLKSIGSRSAIQVVRDDG